MKKKITDQTITSIIGSTGAIVGAAGVTILANTAAPVVAGLATALGTAVAAGALFKKISDDAKPTRPSHRSSISKST